MNKQIQSLNPIWIKVLMALLLATLVVTIALAANPVMNRWVIGSGGGKLDGAGVDLRSMIGQPVAGTVSNGLTLCSGYLCGSGAVGTSYVYLTIIQR